MKQFKNAKRKFSSYILSVLFMLIMQSLTAQGDYESGAKLFDNNCSSCHSGNLAKDATGPALFGITDRAPSREWIKSWIKNNNALRATGDAYANKVYKENDGKAMTGFAWMSDQQLEDLTTYISDWQPKSEPAGGSGALLGCIQEKKQEEEKDAIDYNQQTCVQLRANLKDRGLDTKGRKAVIVARLEEDDASRKKEGGGNKDTPPRGTATRSPTPTTTPTTTSTAAVVTAPASLPSLPLRCKLRTKRSLRCRETFNRGHPGKQHLKKKVNAFSTTNPPQHLHCSFLFVLFLFCFSRNFVEIAYKSTYR